jgi:hypothetical protein
MGLKETINQLRQLLSELTRDLEKAAGGNRAASQRVRTGSVTFAKIAKVYRKESVAAERGSKKGKKPSKKAPAKPVRKKKR